MSEQSLNLKRNAEPTVQQTVRLVSLLSGKGGVGKSVLAFNMAERLASSGRKVLLVDLDAYCGNLHILANVSHDYGLTEMTSGDLSLKEAVTPLADSFDLLAADGRGWPEDISAARASALLASRLRREGDAYSFILIDHPSGKCESSTVMAAASDIDLLVVVPELTSIADACGLYKHLVSTDRSLDCRLLINRAESDDEADYLYRKFSALTERFYGRAPEYLGRILENDAVRRSVAAQQPISHVDEGETVTSDLDEIINHLERNRPVATPAGDDYREKAINIRPAMADIRE